VEGAAESSATTAATTPASLAESPAPTLEQTAIIADLHWLVHQGHVLEFANGRIETARKPNPRPPKPETKPAGAGLEPVLQADSQAEVTSGTVSNPAEPEQPSTAPAISVADTSAEIPTPVRTASEPTNEATPATT
jgi:hypothetical protein